MAEGGARGGEIEMEGEGGVAVLQGTRGVDNRVGRGTAGALVRGSSLIVPPPEPEFEFPRPPGTTGGIPEAGHAGGRRLGLGESFSGDDGSPRPKPRSRAHQRSGLGPGRSEREQQPKEQQYAPGVHEIVPEDAGVLDRRGTGAVARLLPDQGGARALPLAYQGLGVGARVGAGVSGAYQGAWPNPRLAPALAGGSSGQERAGGVGGPGAVPSSMRLYPGGGQPLWGTPGAPERKMRDTYPPGKRDGQDRKGGRNF